MSEVFEDGNGVAYPAVSHDILDIASRYFEALAITGEIGNSVELSGRTASARYACVMPAAMTTDKPQRNVYDPRVRKIFNELELDRVSTRQPARRARTNVRRPRGPEAIQARFRDRWGKAVHQAMITQRDGNRPRPVAPGGVRRPVGWSPPAGRLFSPGGLRLGRVGESIEPRN
jgi:hypothetical protein